MNSKVIIFINGRPKLLAFVAMNAHKQAATLLGVESCKVERVKGEGFCFVRHQDDAARAEWNAPKFTPQLPPINYKQS